MPSLSRTSNVAPTELAITLCCFTEHDPDRTVCADEVRGRLRLLGFDCTTQQVAAWLGRMSKCEAPWVERIRPYGDPDLPWEYRVTRFGTTDVHNRLPGVWWAQANRRAKLMRNVA